VRGESKNLPVNLVLLVLAGATAWIGFFVWA
jgi:hypothetical protein